MNDQADFIDSYAPIDEEICTHGDWPPPEPRKFEPKARASLKERLRASFCGVEHE
jgi:hypothetical protein